MKIHMTFIDRNGRDVTATDQTAGYVFADYFSSDLQEILTLADGDIETANAWVRSAYRGPDIDGIGITWTFEP